MPETRLDLFQLRCLVTLVQETHVTKAAQRLGIRQPAMSAALARLRELLGDPILVRTEKGMMATPRAVDLARNFRSALEIIDQSLTQTDDFNASSASAVFKIAASESVSFLLLPTLLSRVRARAPGITLHVHPPVVSRVRNDLEEGDCDLMIGFLHPAPQGLRSTSLFEQSLRVIASRRHPRISGSLSLDQYLAAPHVKYMLGMHAASTIEDVIDTALNAIGRSREIGAQLPSTLSAPALVAQSDLIATLPGQIAQHFAREYPIQILDVPLNLPAVSTAQYWHERMHNNPAHRWLRSQTLDLAKELGQSWYA